MNHPDSRQRFNEAFTRVEALLVDRREIVRSIKLEAGIDPAPRPRRSIEQIKAEAIARRARNDQADAERQGRWRTID